MSHEPNTENQLAALRAGDVALHDVFEQLRPKLRRTVRLRLAPNLAARVDPSDVLQEAYLEAQQRVSEYLKEPSVGIFVWLRGLVWDRLLKARRAHVETKMRSVDREERIELPGDASLAIATSLTTPSEKMAAAELRAAVRNSIHELAEPDREVILMRYFEHMTNAQIAEALSITPAGATMRHGRALSRLKDVLQRQLGGEAPS